ncbi:hypothetical protein ACFE04_017619 [Oxalis oulophora]
MNRRSHTGPSAMIMKLRSIFLLALFSILSISLVAASDLNSDRQALLDFSAVVPHNRKLNWNPTTPICGSWFGVTCNSNKTRVIGIHLPGFGLSGSLPADTLGKLNSLRVLSLRSNDLNGIIPSDIPSISTLQFLFLQNNKFSGKIPATLSLQLYALDLSFNSFTGNIPSSIQNLTKLRVLRLENNSISGLIPNLNLSRLKFLNLSYNNLDGSIPSLFEKFPNSSFVGNSLLCGFPLKGCSMSPSHVPSQVTKLASTKFFSTSCILGIVIGGLVILFILILMAIVCCMKRKNSEGSVVSLKGKFEGEKPKDFGSGVQEAEKNKLFFFEGCTYSFDLEDLLRASAEVLGKGSFGTAYKAVLEDGTTMVVKRLKEVVVVGKKEFEQEMEFVGKLGQHPNVVPLRAYYYSKDEKLLVYNYMPNGSLFTILHGNRNTERTPFEWDSRLKIALGTARGIAHIHAEGGAKCVHGNIKSSNVLLTRDLEGCISDVGLAPLMTFPISRAIGYRAPEVIDARKITQKSDVYSYGVLLLEMLTGKAPLQQTGRDEVVDLPRWVKSVVREEWTSEVFDVELMRYQNIEEEMVTMLQIALTCVTRVPDSRPNMEDVVRMIEDIRVSDSKNRTSSEAGSNVDTP